MNNLLSIKLPEKLPEQYYNRQISDYANQNNDSFNRYGDSIVTNHIYIPGVLNANADNGYVELFTPFFSRNQTVSKNPYTGSIIVNGGMSITKGNLNIQGIKNPINFFQNSVTTNNIISFEGITIKKQLNTFTLNTMNFESEVYMKGHINGNTNILIDSNNIISNCDVYSNNILVSKNIFSLHNINSNIINDPINIINKSNISANIYNSNSIVSNIINVQNLVVKNINIDVLDSNLGNIIVDNLNSNIILDYNNIYGQNVSINDNISELKELYYPYTSKLITDKFSTIKSNIYTSNIITSKMTQIDNTLIVNNIIFSNKLDIKTLIASNVNLKSVTQNSTINNINQFGNTFIYNKLVILGKNFTGNAQNSTYTDNLIPLNLGSISSDTGIISGTSFVTPNVPGYGIIYRNSPYPDSIIGNNYNSFILGKFINQQNNDITIDLLNIYAKNIYGDLISNTISFGLTSGVNMGNINYETLLRGNIYLTNGYIDNLYIPELIANTLITNKTLTTNVVYASNFFGNTLIPNIDISIFKYDTFSSFNLYSNIINVNGNLSIYNSNLNITSNSMNLINFYANNLINKNIISNTLSLGNNITNPTVITEVFISNISKTNVYNDISANNIYLPINNISSNNSINYRYNQFNQNNLTSNIINYKGDINIYQNKFIGHNNNINNIINNISLTSYRPFIETIYNEKNIILKNKNRSYNFNPFSVKQTIILNENINYISSSHNGEAIIIDTNGNNYVYRYSSGSYNSINTFKKTNLLTNTKTIGINIDGNIIITSDPCFNSNNGNICVRNYNGTQYILNNYLNGSGQELLGYYIDFYHNLIASSAIKKNINDGIVYLYDNNLVLNKTINKISPSKNFGKNISLTNKLICIDDNTNIYTFIGNTIISNININSNNVIIDDSNNFLIINKSINSDIYKLKGNIILSSNTSNLNTMRITGDGSILYSFTNGYLSKYININGEMYIENIYDMLIRGNSNMYISKNGNFLYLTNNGNVYIYN